MPQTFYIENDEEIISVIGRLRKSSSEENYFVFPKRALVLQSIVNLRLFQREAEKLGKRIIIVTQDEAGKLLAEKAGLLTERYTDDFSRQSEHLEISPAPAPIREEGGRTPLPDHPSLRSNEIGSSNFYASSDVSAKIQSAPPATSEMRTLRIRNATPEKQTSLNSKRFIDEAPLKKPEPAPLRAPMTRPLAPPVRPQDASVPSVQSGREERLRNFFSNGGVTPQKTFTPSLPKQESVTPKVAVASHKAGGIFLFLGAVSALSLIGVAIFLFLPKAEVHVIPYRTTQSVDLSFEGRTDTASGDERTVAVRVMEKEEEISLTAQATGAALGSAQKARGTVTIMNAFSADAQSLVATTRLESPEGKIFRLAEGVTVPGMTGSQPGTVEATVIADQTGTDYNIAATTFTIPGFKGSPKYEKFSAKSTKAMAGGSASSGGNQSVISKTDLEKAATEAKEKARQAYLDATKGELLPGERVLGENLDIVPLNDASLPLSGTAATSFEYKNTFKIRGFAFSEETLKQRILSGGEARVGNILFRPTSVVLSYGEAIPDYDAQTVRLKTHALITSESVIDREKLLTAILGKDESGINALLETFPEIKKIEIVFKPQWFTSSVPTTESRVTLLVEPGQE